MMINHSTKELLRLPGNLEMVRHQPSHGLFPKRPRRTGAIDKSTPMNGAMVRLREEKV